MNQPTVVGLELEVYGLAGIASHVGLKSSEFAHVFLMKKHFVRFVHPIWWMCEFQDGLPNRERLGAKLAVEASNGSLVSLER